jgi:hypothetical protein
MPHAFDHGLAKPLRTLVREGVIARLARLGVAVGGYLQAIVPLGSAIRGQEDQDGLDFLRVALNGRVPAVAVSLGAQTFNPAGQGGYQYKPILDVHVYVVTNNLRSREARQAADVVAIADVTKDPGVDIMLEHVSELLIGHQIASSAAPKGQQILELRQTREYEIFNDNSLAVWESTFTVALSREINQKRDVTTAITSLWTFTTLDVADVPQAVVETHQEIP